MASTAEVIVGILVVVVVVVVVVVAVVVVVVVIVVVVVVVIQWCWYTTVSQIPHERWAENAAFGPKSQVRSDTHRLQPELHYNTETLSSAPDNGISLVQSHVLHLSKTIRPPSNVGWDPLA